MHTSPVLWGASSKPLSAGMYFLFLRGMKLCEWNLARFIMIYISLEKSFDTKRQPHRVRLDAADDIR